MVIYYRRLAGNQALHRSILEIPPLYTVAQDHPCFYLALFLPYQLFHLCTSALF